MGQMKLLHCSMSEYILLFGTPIGTEGHSGRYATEVYDFMIDGEMWCYHPGEFERAVYKPGDAAYLGADQVKGYAVPSHAWMLEYARGPIPTRCSRSVSPTPCSARSIGDVGRTVWRTEAGGAVIWRKERCERRLMVAGRSARLSCMVRDGHAQKLHHGRVVCFPGRVSRHRRRGRQVPGVLAEVKKVEIKERSDSALVAKFFVEVKVAGMEVKTEYTVRYKLGESEVSWSLLISHPDQERGTLEARGDRRRRDQGVLRERAGDDASPSRKSFKKSSRIKSFPRMMQRFRDRAEG